MDFPTDSRHWNRKGNGCLENHTRCAVTKAQAKQWTVYLPESSDWYDFWTGESTWWSVYRKGSADRHYSMYVKAGSIIPFGPKVQYAAEKKWDNLEIRIYEGADGDLPCMKTKMTITIMKKECIQPLNLNGLTQRGHLRLVREKGNSTAC